MATTVENSHFIQGIVGFLLGKKAADLLDSPQGWNVLNNSYTTLHEDLTPTIDTMIMETGVPGPTILMSDNLKIPAEGTHYIWYRSKQLIDFYNWVGLIKTVIKHGKREGQSYYTLYHPQYTYLLTPVIRLGSNTPSDIFIQCLREKQKTTIITQRVDATSFEPSLYSLAINHPNQMYPHQWFISRAIASIFLSSRSGTFLICGKRGWGKTTAALDVKRKIEASCTNINVTIISNFNPSQASVDIFKMGVRRASQQNPYIVIINEIDVHMATTITEKSNSFGDRRFSHTADRTTFHDMLDTFALVSNVILIMTTEKSVEQLWAIEEYRSFIRAGRVKGYFQMYDNEGTIATRLETIPIA